MVHPLQIPISSEFIKQQLENMIKMLKEADRYAFQTFIGTALIKFATGIIGLWGTINIYFFSYLRNKGTEITSLTNSTIMLCAIIPASFAVLLSTKLTRIFGYKAIIRTCALVFAFSPFLINLGLNEVTLGLFYLFIPITCFAISSIPILNCLWSQFPNDLNKVSGSAVLFFALGMIIWNMTFLGLVNPRNQLAEIDEHNQAFFKRNISDNVFKASNVVFLCSGTCFLVGSLLVEKRDDSVKRNTEKLAEEMNAMESNENQKGSESAEKLEKMQKREDNQESLTIRTRLRATLKDRKFIILFSISFLCPLYLIYMSLYMKLIFMPILNDDHFLAFCSVTLTVSAIFGAPFWGYIGDKKGFKTTLLLVLMVDCIAKVLGVFCQRKWNLVMLYFVLGFNDKGILTIIGPGLIEIFGLELATELIPYKGIALFLAYVTVPLTQIIFSSHLTYQVILIFFILCTTFATFLAYFFYSKVEYQPYEVEGGAGKEQKELEVDKNDKAAFP